MASNLLWEVLWIKLSAWVENYVEKNTLSPNSPRRGNLETNRGYSQDMYNYKYKSWYKDKNKYKSWYKYLRWSKPRLEQDILASDKFQLGQVCKFLYFSEQRFDNKYRYLETCCKKYDNYKICKTRHFLDSHTSRPHHFYKSGIIRFTPFFGSQKSQF